MNKIPYVILTDSYGDPVYLKANNILSMELYRGYNAEEDDEEVLTLVRVNHAHFHVKETQEEIYNKIQEVING